MQHLEASGAVRHIYIYIYIHIHIYTYIYIYMSLGFKRLVDTQGHFTGVKRLITHFHPVPWFKISGRKPPRPHMPLRHAQEQLYHLLCLHSVTLLYARTQMVTISDPKVNKNSCDASYHYDIYVAHIRNGSSAP